MPEMYSPPSGPAGRGRAAGEGDARQEGGPARASVPVLAGPYARARAPVQLHCPTSWSRLYTSDAVARARHGRRRLPDRVAGRARRDGRRLPGDAARPGADRRAEGDRARAARRRGHPAALPGRGARRGERRPPERDPGARGGRGRRDRLHRDALRGRQRPALAGARAAARWTRPRRRRTSRRRARRWTRSTAPASSTATSSPPTCSWTRAATST